MPPASPICKPWGWPVRCPQPLGSPGSKRLRSAQGITSLPYAAPTWEMLFLCLAALCARHAAKCRGRAMSQRASQLGLSAQCMEHIAGECTQSCEITPNQ